MAAPPTTAMISAAAVLLCAAALLGAADAADAGGGRLLKATAAPAVSGDRLVTIVCANVTSRSRHYGGPGLPMDFCEITLWSDKRAASAAHPRDLALVAMDLVRDGAAAAAAKVGGALNSGAAAKKLSKDAALNLQYCQLDYEAVARTLPVCRAMVQEYVAINGYGPMIAFNYLECANRVVTAARDCWVHLLTDNETKKAVWKEVSEVATRANLAKAMVEQMLGVVDNTDHDAADDDDDDDNQHDIDDDDDDDDNHHNPDGTRHIIDDDDDDDDNHHHAVVHTHHVIDDDHHHHHVVVDSHHAIDNGNHHVVDDDDDD